MSRTDLVKRRRARLCGDASALLDSFLIGTVAKSPSMSGHNLTTKVDGKTVTVYVRRDIVPKAREMNRRYRKLRTIIRELSRVNWELLNAEDNE